MTMSSPLEGAAGLIGNSGRNTADACDANASETTTHATAHFVCIVKTEFTEVRTPFLN
jgi:hypothetical protein